MEKRRHGAIRQSGGTDHGSRAGYWARHRPGHAKEGAKLALVARTRDALEQTAQEVQALGASTCVVCADVSDPIQVDDMVRHTVDRFATIDILVNNAGIAGPVGPLQDSAIDAWVRTVQVN